MGINPLGTGGPVPPKFGLEGTSIALSPKLSEDTRHVGHTRDMPHYSQHWIYVNLVQILQHLM